MTRIPCSSGGSQMKEPLWHGDRSVPKDNVSIWGRPLPSWGYRSCTSSLDWYLPPIRWSGLIGYLRPKSSTILAQDTVKMWELPLALKFISILSSTQAGILSAWSITVSPVLKIGVWHVVGAQKVFTEGTTTLPWGRLAKCPLSTQYSFRKAVCPRCHPYSVLVSSL